nr:polyprenyl synthetase family protein [Rhodothermus marinus]
MLSGTGKRMRPVLLMLAAELYGRPAESVLPAALAVEVFHAFTLVHDDIMDHAAERRGRPTVHVKWDEATALLCGDYLMGLSYALLGQVENAPLARVLAMFHRMVERSARGRRSTNPSRRARMSPWPNICRWWMAKRARCWSCACSWAGCWAVLA